MNAESAARARAFKAKYKREREYLKNKPLNDYREQKYNIINDGLDSMLYELDKAKDDYLKKQKQLTNN